MRSPEISSALRKMQRLRRSDRSAGSFGSASAGSISIHQSPANEKTRLLVHGNLQTSSPQLVSKESMFAPGTEPPPLVQWLPPALICALSYALYNIFIKKGSASIHPILGGVILQIVAALLGIGLCSFLAFGPAKEPMFWDFRGLYFAVLAGLSVGAAEILSFLVNGMGVPAVQSIPVIIGGSVMFGCVIGTIFLGEELSLSGWLGVALIAVGIGLVGMEGHGE